MMGSVRLSSNEPRSVLVSVGSRMIDWQEERTECLSNSRNQATHNAQRRQSNPSSDWHLHTADPCHATLDDLSGCIREDFLHDGDRLCGKTERKERVAHGIAETPEADSDGGAGEGTCEEARERLARSKRKTQEWDEGDKGDGAGKGRSVGTPQAADG